MSSVYDRKDRLYREAKAQGYRSRAAYKLMELDKKFKLLRPGAKVLDLGCFPGGWLQVAAERVGRSGSVIGVDLNSVEAINVKVETAAKPTILQGDICSREIQDQILSLIGGKIDIVLSDLSPKLSGIRFRDAYLSAELVAMAFSVCEQVLAEGGSFVSKIFPGQESEEIAKTIRSSFGEFSRENLDSSRKTSNEFYFVAKKFSSAPSRSEAVRVSN